MTRGTRDIILKSLHEHRMYRVRAHFDGRGKRVLDFLECATRSFTGADDNDMIEHRADMIMEALNAAK